LMSHYCYQSYGTITDGEMVLIQKLLLYTDWLWYKLSRNKQTKGHMTVHMLADLDWLGGLKYHNEGKIKAAHQEGKKTDLRFWAMAGSIEKKRAVVILSNRYPYPCS
jgi:hypothetical protein